MVELLHHDEKQVIVRLPDGRIVYVLDDRFRMRIPRDGKRPSLKSFEYKDLLTVNETLRKIYPNLFLGQAAKYAVETSNK